MCLSTYVLLCVWPCRLERPPSARGLDRPPSARYRAQVPSKSTCTHTCITHPCQHDMCITPTHVPSLNMHIDTCTQYHMCNTTHPTYMQSTHSMTTCQHAHTRTHTHSHVSTALLCICSLLVGFVYLCCFQKSLSMLCQYPRPDMHMFRCLSRLSRCL